MIITIHLQAPLSHSAVDRGLESEYVEFVETEEEGEKGELQLEEVPISLLQILRLNSQDWWLLVVGFVGAFIIGSVFPFFSIVFGEFLRVLSLPSDEILSEIHPWGATFLALGIAAAIGIFTKVVHETHIYNTQLVTTVLHTLWLFFVYFQTLCFQISGENLTARVRVMAFQAMLRQEIGWFDDERNSTGALTAMLASDGGKVQGVSPISFVDTHTCIQSCIIIRIFKPLPLHTHSQVAGTQLGTSAQMGTTLLLSISIAFYYNWLLAFVVVLGVMPFIIIGSTIHFQIVTKNGHDKSADISAVKKVCDGSRRLETH